jgi:hypothetical protein
LAWVNARLERRVDPNLAESEARSMRPKRRNLAKGNARLERGVGSDPNELIFVKTHEGQGVRYKAASGGKAQRHFVSTRPGTASIEQDAMIVSPAGGSITPTKNHVDGAEMKDTNDGHRHLYFPLSSHFEYTMYFSTTIQFYNDTIMQSQYISSQTHTLQIF